MCLIFHTVHTYALKYLNGFIFRFLIYQWNIFDSIKVWFEIYHKYESKTGHYLWKNKAHSVIETSKILTFFFLKNRLLYIFSNCRSRKETFSVCRRCYGGENKVIHAYRIWIRFIDLFDLFISYYKDEELDNFKSTKVFLG